VDSSDNSDGSVLWLLRHAKAASNGPSGDASRPLTGKGRRQADSVREHLQSLAPKAAQILPNLVLCSPAARARETAEIVMPALPEARIQFDQILYDEDAEGVLEWLRLLDPPESRVMLVGHNPTLQELCLILAEPAFHDELELVGLPTAALMRFDVPVVTGSTGSTGSTRSTDWRGLAVGAAKLGHRFVPGS
jgi:phosphohistidine phosphatase